MSVQSEIIILNLRGAKIVGEMLIFVNQGWNDSWIQNEARNAFRVLRFATRKGDESKIARSCSLQYRYPPYLKSIKSPMQQAVVEIFLKLRQFRSERVCRVDLERMLVVEHVPRPAVIALLKEWRSKRSRDRRRYGKTNERTNRTNY